MPYRAWRVHVISTRKNGDRLVGIAGPKAVELYDAGTPPVHGLAAKPPPSPRVANVRIGDALRVQRLGDRWVVFDMEGELGVLRWLPGDDARMHAVSGRQLRFPTQGHLVVQRLLLSPDGAVKDIG